MVAMFQAQIMSQIFSIEPSIVVLLLTYDACYSLQRICLKTIPALTNKQSVLCKKSSNFTYNWARTTKTQSLNG